MLVISVFSIVCPDVHHVLVLAADEFARYLFELLGYMVALVVSPSTLCLCPAVHVVR